MTWGVEAKREGGIHRVSVKSLSLTPPCACVSGSSLAHCFCHDPDKAYTAMYEVPGYTTSSKESDSGSPRTLLFMLDLARHEVHFSPPFVHDEVPLSCP